MEKRGRVGRTRLSSAARPSSFTALREVAEGDCRRAGDLDRVAAILE